MSSIKQQAFYLVVYYYFVYLAAIILQLTYPSRTLILFFGDLQSGDMYIKHFHHKHLGMRPLVVLAVGLSLLLGSACRRASAPPVVNLNTPQKTVVKNKLDYMQPNPVGRAVIGHPWIAHVTHCDLDQDGNMDILACEANENKALWLRRLPSGVFEEIEIATQLTAPVQIVPADMDKDGDIDLLVSCMGAVFPNNDKIGTLLILENDGHQNFKKRVVLENTSRVTDIRPGDFNGDGRIDMAVAQFGYDQGEVCWMECVGDWKYERHVVCNLSGAINVCVADFNNDGALDFAALISQQYEEIFLYLGDGRGNFRDKLIFGSTNEDYATSNMALCDLNRDGRPDLLFSNGDGFGPTLVPGPRPWHGVQWLENLGDGNFKFRLIGYLGGAYAPIEVDLDQDGVMDVVAVSAFINYGVVTPLPSLMWYKNDGKQNFTPYVLAYSPAQLLTVTAADFDKDGRMELITGAFHCNPPYDRMTRILQWKRTGL